MKMKVFLIDSCFLMTLYTGTVYFSMYINHVAEYVWGTFAEFSAFFFPFHLYTVCSWRM